MKAGIEQTIRQLNAGFWIRVSPGSAHWARTRAKELAREGRDFDIVLVWNGQRFRAGEQLFGGDPYLAIEFEDGTLEGSPWAPPEEGRRGSKKARGGAKSSAKRTRRSSEPPVTFHELQKAAIQRALQATRGNVSEAAKLLGIGRATLYRYLAK